LRIFNVDKIS